MKDGEHASVISQAAPSEITCIPPNLPQIKLRNKLDIIFNLLFSKRENKIMNECQIEDIAPLTIIKLLFSMKVIFNQLNFFIMTTF